MSGAAGGAALGLRFDGDGLPGLIEGVPEDLPVVTVEHAEESDLDSRWSERAAAPETIFERRLADGRQYLRVERDAIAGYRVWALRYGTHSIAPDARRCASALPEGPAWRGLKLVAAQVVPLLTTLSGREVLHASGVVVGERLIGIVAASGTGKSTTTCNVIAKGGRFFADDVLALEVAGGRVIAHPGTRLANIHAHDLEAIPEGERARLGEPIGRSDKVHLSPEGYPHALPLGGLLFLERGAHITRTAVASVEDVPAQLLGSAFLPYLDRRERLARQLDVMSTLARTVPLARLQIGPQDGPASLAERVRKWVETLA